MADNNTENQIPDVYTSSSPDRGELSIGSRKNKNKLLIVFIFLFGVLVVVTTALTFAMKAIEANETEAAEIDTVEHQPGEVSGVDRTSVGGSDWFAQVKAEKERKEEQERARIAREEKERERLEAEQARLARANEPVQRTGMSDSQQPTEPVPQVTPKQRHTTTARNAEPTPYERKLNGSVMVDIGGATNPSMQLASSSAPRNYDSSFDAPVYSDGVAIRRKSGTRDYLLQHGMSIPCALYTQVISDYQGFITCKVTQDVYSANGTTLLVERGSVISGSQRIALEPGKNRLFTTWSDVETPNGIRIDIHSLGAGRLGASGNEAWIDNHFKERFGGAILLSFIDDAFSALADKAKSNNSNVQFDNSTSTGSDIAAKALESTIDIKPTGYTKIGQRINIIVARDIDMSTVYDLQ